MQAMNAHLYRKLSAETTAWNERVDLFNRHHKNLHPAQLWRSPEIWPQLCSWFTVYDAVYTVNICERNNKKHYEDGEAECRIA